MVYDLVFTWGMTVLVHCVETSGTEGSANARSHRICLVVKGKCARQDSLPDAQDMYVREERGEVQGARVKEGRVQVALGTHLVLVVPHHVDSLDGRDGHCQRHFSCREGQGDVEGKQRKSATHGMSQGKLVCCNDVRCRVEVDECFKWRKHAASTTRDHSETKQR